MYAIEYPKQARTTPLVITIGIHLVLFYAVAVGLHVVPSPLGNDTMTVVTVPVVPDEPEPMPHEPTDSQTVSVNLTHVVPHDIPTFVIAQDAPQFGTDLPVIDVATGGTPIIDEPITNARIKYSPETPYPAVSRIRDEQGTVLVKVMISPYGTVGDVQIEKSSGFPRLDDAALKAVRGWKFVPASRGSQAIATWVIVPVKFVLNGVG
jgi:periplasmic protein TonB